MFSSQCGTSFVTAALNHTTYESVLDGIYSGPHLMGHIALAMMVGPDFFFIGVISNH
jgi:tyrosinase